MERDSRFAQSSPKNVVLRQTQRDRRQQESSNLLSVKQDRDWNRAAVPADKAGEPHW